MMLGGLARDLGFALRSLRRRLAMVAVAAGTPAIAIGLDVTVIARLDAILIRPLPVAGARITSVVWLLLGNRPLLGRDLEPADGAGGKASGLTLAVLPWRMASWKEKLP